MKYQSYVVIAATLISLLSGCASVAPKSSSTDTALADTSLTEKIPVRFAGFALMGDQSDITKRYPYSSAIVTQTSGLSQLKQQSKLDEQLTRALAANKPEYMTLSADSHDAGNTKLSLAVALTQEQLSIDELYNGKYRVAAQISAQILILDFTDLKIVAAYPLLPVQYIEQYPHKPSDAQIKSMFNQIYFGDDNDINLFSLAAQRIKLLLPDIKSSNSLQVASVTIEPKAEAVLQENGQESELIKAWLAQSFSAYLSQNQRVSMLPYSKDSAIGNKMTASFSNNEVYTLTIPDPEYAVNLWLRGFVSKEYKSTPAKTEYANASYHQVSVTETFDNENYMKGKFKHSLPAVIPAGQSYTDKWSVYVESILKFYEELSIQFGKPTKAWLKRHAGDTVSLKQFKRIKSEVLERSR